MELQDTNRAYRLTDDIGVVVIGRNEGERLVDCLNSIEPRKIITVYVDSGSSDDSVAMSKRLGATVVALDMTRPFTAGRARNEGVAALTAIRPQIRFVQFLDGDCELDGGWLAAALAFVTEHEDIAVVCGRRRERFPDSSVYNWLCEVEWDTPIGEASTCGGDSLIRKSAFDAVNGFRSQLMAGEEPELCLRLRQNGWRIWRLDADMTRHDAAITRLSQWWRRTVRSGYGYAEGFMLHVNSSPPIWKREVARAILWGGLLPLAILLGTLSKPITIVAVLIYPLQIARIAIRKGAMVPHSWTFALFMTLAKFAEFDGILKYFWRRLRGNTGTLIEYKQTGHPIG